MELKIAFVFLCCMFLTVKPQADPPKKMAPAHLLVSNCHPEHPYMSVGDLFITDNNFTAY